MATKLFRYLVFMLRIRRVEFRIAEIPIVAIPVLVLVRDASVLTTFAFWEGIFVFFLLFAYGDMINCLADRDLDAIYKPHLSESVYGLGVPFVTFQIVLSAVLAILLSAHLSYTLERPSLFVMTVVGLALGTAYSVEPVRLKGRGLLQVLCLWAIIFVGPMLFVAQLVSAHLSAGIVLLAVAYGAIQMGIVLVNTAEDYPEDKAAGINTSIVSVGLRNGIGLAFWLTVAGGLGTLITLVWLFWPDRTWLECAVGILPFVGAAFFVLSRIGILRHAISGLDVAESASAVKLAAKSVPIWITIVAWSTLWAAAALFYFG